MSHLCSPSQVAELERTQSQQSKPWHVDPRPFRSQERVQIDRKVVLREVGAEASASHVASGEHLLFVVLDVEGLNLASTQKGLQLN